MKKKLILLSIILFPSLIYLFFEMTQANFKKMAYFGPKTVDAKGDTVYWSVPNTIFYTNFRQWHDTLNAEGKKSIVGLWNADTTYIDTTNYPVYVILFIDQTLKKEGYKLQGIYDYVKYKAKDIKDVPIFFVSSFYTVAPDPDINSNSLHGEFDSLKINLENFHPLISEEKDIKRILFETYFKQKPVHVFNYFMVLVDKKRHIRGYYDPTFNAEITRMVKDYKHLKIRDEYAHTLKQNDIKQK